MPQLETKICCVIPSLKIGGMERVMTELVNNFVKRKNVEVHLFLYGKHRETNYSIDFKIVTHKPCFKFKDSYRTISTVQTIIWLRKEIKKIDPTVILSFGEYWNNLVLLSLFGLSYSIFISDRSKPDLKLGVIHDFLRKHLYKRTKGIICQTESAKRITLQRYAYKNVTVIGNPIREIKNHENIERENIILTVGRIIKTKNIDRLITVFHKLNMPSWKLVIIGEDSNKQRNLCKLKEQVKVLNLEKNVFFEGYTNNIDACYLRSKIFAFMSDSEGFPNVIGEALSAGLPVVAYDCAAGPRDMINDGENGFLVPLYDEVVFFEKLNYLISFEKARESMGLNAKQSLSKFDADLICEKFYKFIT